MSDPTKDEHRPPVEPLDQRTREEWLKMSAQAAAANVGPWPSRVNKELDAAAQSEPQSPVAPAYRLWIADNLAREGRYLEAIKAFDSAIDSAQSARRFLPHVDPICCSLLHKAQAAALGGELKVAISSLPGISEGVAQRRRSHFFRPVWSAETEETTIRRSTFIVLSRMSDLHRRLTIPQSWLEGRCGDWKIHRRPTCLTR